MEEGHKVSGNKKDGLSVKKGGRVINFDIILFLRGTSQVERIQADKLLTILYSRHHTGAYEGIQGSFSKQFNSTITNIRY